MAERAEQLRQASRRYYEKNRARLNAEAAERQRAWRAAHPDEHREYQTAWARRPEVRARTLAKRRAFDQAKRARKRAAFVERVSSAVVFERDAGVCGICGLPADPSDWHLDHVIPLVRGGEHSYANVQVSHPRCNLSKGAR